MPPLRLWNRLYAMPRKKGGAQNVSTGGSGFCRNELMSWCEQNPVDYVLTSHSAPFPN
jgi:hypothetical protein